MFFFKSGLADTSNFDEEFTREKPTLTPVHGQLTSRDQAEFNGFSWVRVLSFFPNQRRLIQHSL